jgi:hypothetical protein
MSNLFKKVRIVHSPEEERYYVEQKRVWSWRWQKIDVFGYVNVRSASPHGCHDLAGDAFDKAKKKAEMLLARTVVWEQSNYTWGA